MLIRGPFVLIGFPTQEEELPNKKLAGFGTLFNTSKGTFRSGAPSAFHYKDGNLLTGVDEITDKAEENPPLSKKSAQISSLPSSPPPSASSSSVHAAPSIPLSQSPASQPKTIFSPSGSSSSSSSLSSSLTLPSASHNSGVPTDDSEGEDEDEEVDVVPVEQRLMKQLLRNYERSVRPVKNASDIVLVRMGLTLTQIFDMVRISFISLLLCVVNISISIIGTNVCDAFLLDIAL